MSEILSRRALNRALLARQLLLWPPAMAPLAAVEHLGGLQAQAPLAPYTGLWARLAAFDPSSLAGLMESRQVVRIALQRSTIHLVSAADCLAWRRLVQPVLVRSTAGNHGRAVAGLDWGLVAAEGRRLVDQEPRTFAWLGAALAERWPSGEPAALAMVVRALVPLVQVPPRGIWGKGGLARHTSAEAWLGRGVVESPSVDDLVLRYLGAFGPASVRDAQVWSGVGGLGPVFARLREGGLVDPFRDEAGRELFDLPDAPRPDPGTPAPVRFLPEYDNLLLSHHDRTRVIAPGYGARTFVRGALLVDGFVCGAWKIERGARAGAGAGASAVLALELFAPLGRADRAAVQAEGERLLAFAAAGAVVREVRVTLG